MYLFKYLAVTLSNTPQRTSDITCYWTGTSSDPSQIRWIGRFFLSILLDSGGSEEIFSCYAEPGGSEEGFRMSSSVYG